VLPRAWEVLEWGLLTAEQTAVVVTQLSPLSAPDQLRVWQRLLARLSGAGLPPARLTKLLRQWVIEADREGAEQRRRQAELDRRVEYRRRGDGLHDLFAFGFRAPVMQAILSRIQDRSAPFGADDDRTADQRRFDALVDMLMGRDRVPGCGAATAGAACGCRLGEAAPCGADVQVHVPIGGALGITDEVAELVGHGPIESDLLQDLLANSPRLTPVFVDEVGIPVAVGTPLPPIPRDDPAALRAALLQLAEQPPPPKLHPRHPNDHPPPEAPARAPAEPDAHAGPASGSAATSARSGPPRLRSATLIDEVLLAATALGAVLPGAHPTGRPGPYKVTGRLRRLLFTRALRCEFPGCGARAVRCDAEHDLPWPAGPTCACNLGPCCRRHHRVKQEGWTKTRQADGSVRWTTRTGRTWTSRNQHQPPATPVRALPHLPTPNPLDELSPSQLEEALWWLAECPDDPAGLELRTEDREPDDTDRTRQRLVSGDTSWSLDLQNPYAWL
jgi:hypothetical protein